MAKSKLFIVGVLCGGAITGAAALLASPASNELKRKLKEKGKEWKQSLHELKLDGNRLKVQTIEALSEGKNAIAKLKDEMPKSLSIWQANIEPNKEKIQQELDNLTKTLENLQQTLPPKH
ncbi:YtxH domain-containing protein [Bacillus sp. 165]|uniref:YtxH domain-containing protein n=1 Tax=Bacillus sp. 165 TaxID=1529117 RepID=UPI001ADC7470|nr:YtxH domain-containing protein [Bacillus sp. 165]MBO9128728.1 YtxH domain-containing protein [Bacillus sp. 165]